MTSKLNKASGVILFFAAVVTSGLYIFGVEFYPLYWLGWLIWSIIPYGILYICTRLADSPRKAGWFLIFLGVVTAISLTSYIQDYFQPQEDAFGYAFSFIFIPVFLDALALIALTLLVFMKLRREWRERPTCSFVE